MEDFPAYMKRLRTQQRLSLREVTDKTGVSAPYVSQIERGLRRPGADVLKRLAPAYLVPVRDLLRAAGYLEEVPTELSEEDEVDMAFRYVMNDPRYQSGTRISGELTTDVKRFVVEMYEKATGKRLLP